MSEMGSQVSVVTRKKAQDIPLWRRKSFLETTHHIFVYTLLIGLSLVVLMPLGWMITAA